MQLGNIEVQSTATKRETLIMLLWGKPGCGKTVLAATAPGRKLWLQFDPAGTASLSRSDNILVADFSGYKPAQLANFKQGGIIEKDLMKLIETSNIDTVVVDSLTSFGQLALNYAILSGTGSRGTFKATIEQPGQTGYGVRSAMILDFCTMVIRVCSDLKKHCIFTAHDGESMSADGSITEITIALGGQGKTALPAKISEIWHIEDTGKQRLVYVRAHGLKRPMRSRMFALGDKTNFTLQYNQEKEQGDGIKEWYEAWQTAGFNKIELPSK